ncbi:helix-turn-helix domain-containing protein [Kitasatospora griseola]
MVFQKDLDRAAVGEERYQLALALRELAHRLGISLTRYAARVTWDRSSLSRFFSGFAVPPADFVEQLVADGDRALGAELTPAVCELVRGLHRAALTVANPQGAQLQRLRDELADAEQQNGLLQQEQRLLRDMVITANQQIEDRDAGGARLPKSGHLIWGFPGDGRLLRRCWRTRRRARPCVRSGGGVGGSR